VLQGLAENSVIVGLLAALAYRSGALDRNGCLAAAFLGLLILEFGGVYPFLALLVFVILGVMATKYRFHDKSKLGIAQHNRGVRSWGNVLGNGLGALIFILFEYVSRRDVFWAASFAAIATANGDTLASELGKVFGRRPRLITNLQPVKAGTNGGITLAGELFALAGSAAIAIFALPLTGNKMLMLLAVVAGGFIGVNLDSLIGATLENRGITDNNSTNFLASFLGGLTGAVVYYLLMPSG